MELKDMILSTLAELEEDVEVKEELTKKSEITKENTTEKKEVEANIEVQDNSNEEEEDVPNKYILEDERAFCESVRERVLVLFEGFQSPNNKSIEAKVDLTLNFLEYLLAVIDERLEKLDKK
ncbi:CiaD-like domain-containing protein [Sulfurospirillum sp. 1307]